MQNLKKKTNKTPLIQFHCLFSTNPLVYRKNSTDEYYPSGYFPRTSTQYRAIVDEGAARVNYNEIVIRFISFPLNGFLIQFHCLFSTNPLVYRKNSTDEYYPSGYFPRTSTQYRAIVDEGAARVNYNEIVIRFISFPLNGF